MKFLVLFITHFVKFIKAFQKFDEFSYKNAFQKKKIIESTIVMKRVLQRVQLQYSDSIIQPPWKNLTPIKATNLTLL
ncbi:hypothetical protein BGP78_20370 [Pseudoalteromonas sp. MSK9-3]|nr:hypothetical protein BGP78_20370 [Pseudoalteromonas sp. MSK9-3]